MVQIALHKIKAKWKIFHFLVRLFTRSEYSHASIKINDEVWDARFIKGVQKYPGFIFKGEVIDVFNVKGLTKEQVSEAKKWLNSQVGKKYDIWMVVAFLTTQNQENRKSKKKFFCSELVTAVFQHINRPLFQNSQPYLITPAILSYNKDLQFKETIVT